MAEKPGPSSHGAAAQQATAVTVTTTEDVLQSEGTVRVKLIKPKSDKQVKWGAGTVDNEHMNKKKSKCCCIYKKPKVFGDSSSSDSEEECQNCYGHKGTKGAHESCPREPPPQEPVDSAG